MHVAKCGLRLSPATFVAALDGQVNISLNSFQSHDECLRNYFGSSAREGVQVRSPLPRKRGMVKLADTLDAGSPAARFSPPCRRVASPIYDLTLS